MCLHLSVFLVWNFAKMKKIKREFLLQYCCKIGKTRFKFFFFFGSQSDCDFSLVAYPKVTLDKGPRGRVQWNWTLQLVKSFKLVLRLVDKGLGTRWIKLQFSFHGIILEGQLIGLDQKKKEQIQRRAQDLENQSVS